MCYANDGGLASVAERTRFRSIHLSAYQASRPLPWGLKVPALDKFAEVRLQRVAARAGQPDGLSHGHTPVLPGEFGDLQRQGRQGGEDDLLTLDRNTHFEPSDLLGQRAQEEQQPWLPIRRIGTNGALRLPQSQVIGLLARLDHALAYFGRT